MQNAEEAELPDYGERKVARAFIPATQLHLEGPVFLTEPKKALVVDLAESRDRRKQKLRAA